MNSLTRKSQTSLRADSAVLIQLLRSLRDWSQAELAAASGVDLKTVQRYEAGTTQPTTERLGKICAAVGLPASFVERALLPLLRLSLEIAAEARKPPSEPLYDEADETGAELGERLGALAKARLLLVLAEAERAAEVGSSGSPIRPEHRVAAREAWRVLQGRTADERSLLLDAAPEVGTWALAELLCEESAALINPVETGEPAAPHEALELAALAVRVAEGLQADETWRCRVSGYASAFEAQALAAAGDLPGAETAMRRAWEQWKSGGAAPSPLAEWRLLEIEAELRRRQGRFEEALDLQERALRARERAGELSGFEAAPVGVGPVN